MADFINNYIIGLGGTGGESVAAFRKATVLRHAEYRRLKDERGAHFEYLYVDSNTLDVQHAREGSGAWQVVGGDISLTDSECFSIDGSGLTMASAKALPNISPWFGNTIGVADVHSQGGGNIVGAGQRRRYGRMLLARKAQQLGAAIANGIIRLRKDSRIPNSLTFHIFATLGGGTGSGSVVDLVTLLCQMVQNPEIMLYLYVGGSEPWVQQVDAGYFYQNEYAALRDLNALMCNRWHPDLAASPHGGIHHVNDPILATYLSSEMSDTCLALDKQVDCMANACFDIITLMRRGGAGVVAHAFTGEDVQLNNPGECTAATQGARGTQIPPAQGDRPERSYRFQTVGVSRCKEPVMEIRTALKAVFAEQVADRWLNGSLEKRDTRRTTAEDNADVYNADMRPDDSALAENHRNYEKAILDDFTQTYAEESIDFTPNLLSNINERVRDVMADIRSQTEEDTAERKGLASPMQKMCTEEADALASMIAARLENRRSWGGAHRANDPIWGTDNIVSYLTNLIQWLKNATVNKLPWSSDIGNMEAREEEWRKICGFTEWLTDKSSDMYEMHIIEAKAVLKRALAERRRIIRQFTEKLLITRLDQMLGRMLNVSSTIQNLMQQQTREAETQIRMAKATSADTVLIFDEEKLNAHLDYLRSAAAEAQIAESLVRFEALRSVDAKLHIGYPIAGLDSISEPLSYWQESVRVHDWLVETYPNKYHSAYHASVFAALQDLDAKERQDKLNQLSHNVHTLAGISGAPDGGTGLLELASPPPMTAIAVGMPESDLASDNIRKEVATVIQNNNGGKASPGKFQTYTHDDPHELRILTCKYWLPVRYFSVCSYVKSRYDDVLANGSVDARTSMLYYTHADDKDDEKPEIIPMEHDAVLVETKLYFELGKYLPLPEIQRNGETAYAMYEEHEGNKENALRIIKTEAFEMGLCSFSAYSADCLRRNDIHFGSHVRQVVKAWMTRYAAEWGQKVQQTMKEIHRSMTAGSTPSTEKTQNTLLELINLCTELCRRA